MNIYITLDYELFFGEESGSVDNCIINPTIEILNIVDSYNIKLNCFVDAGYLIALEKHMQKNGELKEDYAKICKQIKYLASQNHEIGLHIHPHWEDTIYFGGKWIFDTRRYKLSDFSKEEASKIISKYVNILKIITGKSPIVYRAGGWSAQPFSHISQALKENGIKIDSSVYPKGVYNSKNQVFDFSKVPKYKTFYNFSDDLVKEEAKGDFIELPISSYRVSPFFYWRFAINKIFKFKKHISIGDGYAIKMNKKEIIRLMLYYSYSVVSIDGFKSLFLERSLKKYEKHTKKKDNFILIGHPKAFSKYSLKKTKNFLKNNYKKHSFKTYSQFLLDEK